MLVVLVVIYFIGSVFVCSYYAARIALESQSMAWVL